MCEKKEKEKEKEKEKKKAQKLWKKENEKLISFVRRELELE